MLKNVLPGLALAAVIVVATGCGGSSSNKSENTGSTPAPSGTAQQTTMNESEFKLSPSTLNVTKPRTVTIKIVNKGTVDHAFEVEGNGVEEKSSTVSAGKSTTLTVDFSKAGSYEMYCPIDGHKDQGMRGTITVGGSSAGGGTGGTTTGETTKTDTGYGY